jgi:hypothetical protein
VREGHTRLTPRGQMSSVLVAPNADARASEPSTTQAATYADQNLQADLVLSQPPTSYAENGAKKDAIVSAFSCEICSDLCFRLDWGFRFKSWITCN